MEKQHVEAEENHNANNTNLQNTDTHNNLDLPDTEPYFGDIPEHPTEGTFRVMSNNMNNLPIREDPDDDTEYQGDKCENEAVFKAIQDYGVDILLMQETGVNWSHLARKNQWRERVSQCLDVHQTKSKLSHNCHDATGQRRQWGGTGVFTYGRLAHHAMGAGSDKAQLGRWTWAHYQGRGGMAF